MKHSWIEFLKAHQAWVSVWDWASVVLEVVLIVFTAWFLPTRLPLRWWGAPFYLAVVVFLWLAFAIQAMFLDSVTGADVPGIGYFLPGFLFGIVGLVVWLGRDWRQRQKRLREKREF